jgi:hypothetical protein
MLERVTREVFARELLPARARWWLAAAGMRDWYSVLARSLRPHLGDKARPIIARLTAAMLARRYQVLRAEHPRLPDERRDPRAPALLWSALYRLATARRGGWILMASGGPAHGARERLRAARLLAMLDADTRWREVTVHLGELLIVMTEELPAELPGARKILGDLCFDAGVRYARRMKKVLALPEPPDDGPARALEVLRTSEYLFRVNPEHWGETDAAAQTGWLEGTSCPWWDRPGWTAGHCGIFGQFQNGVCFEFGLRYQLGKTIPKHGGTTCRIDVSPIPASALARRQRERAERHADGRA